MNPRSTRAIGAVVCLGVALTIAMPAAPAAQRSAAAVMPSPESIVARHVEAIGGAAALGAIQSIHARGRLEVPAQGILAAFELYSARPARMLYRVTVPGVGRIENGYNGLIGWTMSPISGPEVLAGRQLEEVAEDAWFDAALHSQERVREMTTLGQTTFDSRPAWRLRIVFRSGRDQVEYFDAETGFQIGSESSRATPQGIVPTVNILRNYQRFGDLLQATVFVQRALGFEQVVTITSSEYDQVPDGTFTPPPAIAALLPSR